MKTFVAAALLVAGGYCSPTNAPRQALTNLTVDLGYAVYRGVQNASTGLNTWKGIRYAAPPIGKLRWRAPVPPANTTNVTTASEFGPNCPQAYPAVPNAPFLPGNEDCLFLNVYAPSGGSQKKPVLVWIHGGGYGLGDGTQDLTTIINANGNAFVGVSIQYRLGAFGFLSSGEVAANGKVNAGLLDMGFALKWVEKNIEKFGGDHTRVTISGESAGGGAVMLLAISNDGTTGTKLFRNGIAASPYLPPQYDYNASIPTQRFKDFVAQSGCAAANVTLDCLRSADSLTLQYANSNITTKGTYGTWAYIPVTDYSFIKSLPSVALNERKVNGENMLVGNNANEGALFVPPTIQTVADLRAWLHLEFPAFSDAAVQSVLDAYPSSTNSSEPKFATDGIGAPSAIDVSQVARGQQQRAYNIYAEATFVCPSYWLNNAYASENLSSYHYQYSVPFASHGDDVTGYFGPSAPNQPPTFSTLFRKIWGNFVTAHDPSVATENATARWPRWAEGKAARLVNLNTTGGEPYQVQTMFGVNVTQFRDPGVQDKITVADAYRWEGGRGQRCEFWRSIAAKAPI